MESEYEIEWTERGRPQRGSKKQALQPKESKAKAKRSDDYSTDDVSSTSSVQAPKKSKSSSSTAKRKPGRPPGSGQKRGPGRPPKAKSAAAKRSSSKHSKRRSSDTDSSDSSSSDSSSSDSDSSSGSSDSSLSSLDSSSSTSSSDSSSDDRTSSSKKRKRVDLKNGSSKSTAKKESSKPPAKRRKVTHFDSETSSPRKASSKSTKKPTAPKGTVVPPPKGPPKQEGDLPGGYASITRNHFVNRKERHLKDDDIPVCTCKPKSGEPGCSSNDQCVNRMLNIECMEGYCPCGETCANRRIQQKEGCKIHPFWAGGKGWGIKAQEAIPKGGFVIEYVGEVIDAEELDRRTKKYQHNNHFYFLTLAGNECIDASRKGNWARFINHSCSPNCMTQKWQIDGEIHVGIFAVKDIAPGEELTFDYQFERFGPVKQKCLCGAPNCCQYLGGKPIKLQEEKLSSTPKSKTKLSNTQPQVSWLLTGQKLAKQNFIVTLDPVFNTPIPARPIKARKARAATTSTDTAPSPSDFATEEGSAANRTNGAPAVDAAASSAVPNGTSEPKEEPKPAADDTEESSSDSSDYEPEPGHHRSNLSRGAIMLRRVAEPKRRAMLAQYHKYVYGSLEWVKDQEKRKESEKINSQVKKKQSSWMIWSIPIERLVRKGKVILDRSADTVPVVDVDPTEGASSGSAIPVE